MVKMRKTSPTHEPCMEKQGDADVSRQSITKVHVFVGQHREIP